MSSLIPPFKLLSLCEFSGQGKCAKPEDRNLLEAAEKIEQHWRGLSPQTGMEATPLPGWLGRYFGKNWNGGSGEMTKEIKDVKLSIGVNDRIMGFTLEPEHLSGVTKYFASQQDYFEDYTDDIDMGLALYEDRVISHGLDLDGDIDG